MKILFRNSIYLIFKFWRSQRCSWFWMEKYVKGHMWVCWREQRVYKWRQHMMSFPSIIWKSAEDWRRILEFSILFPRCSTSAFLPYTNIIFIYLIIYFDGFWIGQQFVNLAIFQSSSKRVTLPNYHFFLFLFENYFLGLDFKKRLIAQRRVVFSRVIKCFKIGCLGCRVSKVCARN